MAKELSVEVYAEQRALLTLTVEDDATLTQAEITRLALEKLDASGGLEWQTEAAWVTRV